jgi:serine/threonine protein kinase/tetratricopeptide (TPR) repeat protein
MPSSEVYDPSFQTGAIARLAPEDRERLTDILDGYLRGLESGVPPDPEALAAEHPDLADALRSYLGSLSALHDMAAGFAGEVVDTAEDEDAAFETQRRLGDFVLKREIGRGGMGVVYEAWQISLARMVALKVLPFAAVLDAKQIARFKNEAQAAAQLHHPNIVPVFAIGVERGVHYYAMPYIDGQPLDQAIGQLREAAGATAAKPREDGPREDEPRDENGADKTPHCPSTLSGSLLTQRSPNPSEYFHAAARLGIQAAKALHAAHEYGVVHRDIKPSNLLLDQQGKLWITDFGLARCQSDASLTKTGDLVGTLRYMSPEQALGQSALVDQRTDIYSLAVTLYELVTLRPAFSGESGPEMLRQIESREPARPRVIDPRIPIDLETVILKAMSKVREDRYATADEFAQDLQRFLEGKPTAAQRATIIDRLAKWSRRHRRFVVGSAAACLVAMTGLAISTLLIAQAKLAADSNSTRAQRHYQQARDAVDKLGFGLANRLAKIPGAEHLRNELLDHTLNYYREFVAQVEDEPLLRADLAMTHSKIAGIQGQIGSKEEAIAAYERAIKLLTQLNLDEPRNPNHRRALARCESNLGLLLADTGRTDEADAAYRRAIDIGGRLVAEFPDEIKDRADLAQAHNNRGLLYGQLGQADRAEQSYREAIELQTGPAGDSRLDLDAIRSLAASYNNLAAVYAESNPQRAIESYREALDLLKRVSEIEPGVLEHKEAVALAYNNLGVVHAREGNTNEAERCYHRAIELQSRLVAAAPALKSYRQDLAFSYNNLGLLHSKLRRPTEAEKSYREALGLVDILARQHTRDLGFQGSLGGIYNNLGIVLEDLKRPGDAAEAYERAAVCAKVAFEGAPQVPQFRSFLSKIYYNQGRVFRQLGRPRDAAEVALLRRALWADQPQRLVAIAEELALAAAMLRRDDATRDDAKRYGEAAVAMLRQVVVSGNAPTNLQENEILKSLRDYDGYSELVQK